MAVEPDIEQPIILFDGVCNLCNGVIRFIIPRDPDATFRFAPLQSEAGQTLLERFDLPTDRLESFVLIEDNDYYRKSDAVLRIAKHLGGLYGIFYVFRFIPRRVRDAVYDFVADHRYQWFGKQEQCMVPTPEIKARFLE